MKHLKQIRVSSNTKTRPSRFTLRLYYQLADETVLLPLALAIDLLRVKIKTKTYKS